jgi:UDP:flavonoid glycosyltransferase YjiC (YdhE family)
VRILVTTTPGHGHVHPMVPLARALAARGHEVTWAAAADACARLRAEGFAAEPAGLPDGEGLAAFAERFPEIVRLPAAERPERMFQAYFGGVRAGPMLRDLMPVARRLRPHLVVSEQAELAGPIVAAAAGVPGVTHGFGRLLPPGRVAAAGEVVADLWRGCGLEPRPYAGTYDAMYLDIYPPGMRGAEPGHVRAVQPLRPVAFGGSGADGDADLPEGPEPLVYITFGTVAMHLGPLAAAVEAVRALPVRAVVTVGRGHDPDDLGRQPPNVRVAGYVPQTAILPRCAAVVSHGGSGTFLAALGLGIPQVLLPQGADQFLNAEAGAASGAARVVPPDRADVATIRAAVEEALGDLSVRAAAERMAAEIRAMPSPDEVAEVLERRFAPARG